MVRIDAWLGRDKCTVFGNVAVEQCLGNPSLRTKIKAAGSSTISSRVQVNPTADDPLSHSVLFAAKSWETIL